LQFKITAFDQTVSGTVKGQILVRTGTQTTTPDRKATHTLQAVNPTTKTQKSFRQK
jgi:hypothetical protein